MATHDVELAAACADRVVLMGEGQVVVDGPAREVMSDSQVFASQINKLFRDPHYLVVDDVLRRTGRTSDRRRESAVGRVVRTQARFSAAHRWPSASIMALASLIGLGAFLYPFFLPSACRGRHGGARERRAAAHRAAAGACA